MREYILNISGREYKAEVKEMTADYARIVVNNTEYVVDLVELGRKKISAPEFSRPMPPAQQGQPSAVTASPMKPRAGHSVNGEEGITAPLPGLILEVSVSEGDTVHAGQNLILMEAMKMENQIKAPYNGSVKKVYVKKDDNVMEGDVLVEITRPVMTTL